MPAQAAGLSFSHSARNRFEFHRTKEPNSEQRAARAATDGRHAVPSIGFSGGKTAILGVRSTLFCFAAAVSGIIEMHTIKSEESIFMALIAVSYNLDFSGLCATRRLFKMGGCCEREILFIRQKVY